MAGGCWSYYSPYDLALRCLSSFKDNTLKQTGHWADLTNPEYTGVGVGFAIVPTGEYSGNFYDSNGHHSGVYESYEIRLAILTMDKAYE